MNHGLRALLRMIGKRGDKIAVVFGFNANSCHAATVHLRTGAPGIPVWLFSATDPLPETAALCERVFVCRGSLGLLLRAQTRLCRRWVALSAGTWTGERGRWAVKLAPLLVPPFRAVLLNKHGDFFSGTPRAIALHCRRTLRDGIRDAWHSGPLARLRDGLRGYGVWAAGCVLRLCSYPHRGRFDRLHGTGALSISPAPDMGTAVASFRQHGQGWLGDDFEEFLGSTHARWVLWQQDDADGPVDDMLALMSGEHVFAASRQEHYRAWKPIAFAMAPFRTLQPGEASQVLAPLSSTILVERRKLLALGIPRCGLARTAWLLIFWRAAAAGWRSYSVGQSGPLAPQPDFPAEEAALLAHILTDRSLRRLGPREPELSRGAIAFPAAQPAPPARVSGNRPRVLVVAPFLPYPLSHGGAVRMYNLCGALSGRVDFLLVAVREADQTVRYDKLAEIFRQVYVVDLDEPPAPDPNLPRQIRQHRSGSLRALVAELARTWRPDVLQVEYTHMAAFRESAPGVPAILVEHDLTFSLYEQLAQRRGDDIARDEYRRWLDFETRWLRAYDGVWTVSAGDREEAIRTGGRTPELTFTVPNGVDIDRFTPVDAFGAVPEVFYAGSFRHLPNLIAFEALRREVMPQVWNRFPSARLRVVAGPDYERFWREFPEKDTRQPLDSRIDLHGFVEDLRPFYARASVVVVPLAVSAGTNIKVLEAMACGKAIVSTTVGCAGLGLRDGEEIAIRDGWSEFAGAVSDLLSDAGRRTALGAAARRTAEGRFSWTAISEAAYESYLVVAGRGPRTGGRGAECA